MANEKGKANPWLVFAIGAAAHFTVMFNRVAVGQMFPQLMAEFSTTGVGVAALSSIYYYTYALMQVPAGALADTLGSRRVMSGGMLIGAVGWFIFASSRSLAIASAARLLSGFGLAGIFLGLLKSISVWFPASRYGTLTGISTFFGNLGVATAMFPFVILVGAIGWRGSSYAVSGATLIIAILIWIFVRDDSPHRSRSGGHHKGHTMEIILKGTGEIIRSKGSWQPLIGFMLVFGGLMTFTGLWGAPFMMQVHGITQSTAGSFLVVSTAGGATAAVLIGWLTDRSGRPKLLFCILACLQAASWLMLLYTMRIAGTAAAKAIIAAAMLLMGVSNSSFLPAFVIIRKMNRVEVSSLAQGLNNASGFVGAITIQALVSGVMDKLWKGAYFSEGVRLYPQGAYSVGFALCLGAIAIAVACGLMMPKDEVR